MSQQFDLDFRIFEIETTLDIPTQLNLKGAKNMAMTVFQQAQTLILAGKYERTDMEYKLKRYLDKNRITKTEYDELISMMDAQELMNQMWTLTLIASFILMTLIYSCLIVGSQADDDMEDYFKNKKKAR